MPPTVTLQVQEAIPKLLLIASPSELSFEIARLFEQNDVPVLTLSLSEVLTQSKIDENLYKIIWLAEPKATDEKQITLLATKLNAQKTPLVICIPFFTAIKHNSSFLAWSTASQKQVKTIESISTNFTNAHYIFLENVLAENNNNELFEYISVKNEKNSLVVPDINMNFLAANEIVDNLTEPLFRPGYHQSIHLKGPVIEVDSLFQRIEYHLQHIQKQMLNREKVAVETLSSIPFSVLEKSISQKTINEAIQAQIRLIPRLPDVIEPVITQDLPKPVLKPVVAEKTVVLSPPVPTTPEPVENKPTPASEPVVPEVDKPPQQVKKTEKPAETFESPQEVNKELERIFNSSKTEKKAKRVVQIAKVEDKIVKKSKHKKILFWGGLGIVGAGLGLISLLTILYGSMFVVKNQLQAYVEKSVNEEKAEPSAFLHWSTEALKLQTNLYAFAADTIWISQANELAQISQDVQDAQVASKIIETQMQSLFASLMKNEATEITTLTTELQKNAELIHEKLASAQGLLQTTVFASEDPEEKKLLADYEKQLAQQVRNSSTTLQLAPLLPSLLGAEQPRTYALILQNNQELRPTGGFIQSVAIIEVAQGKITQKEFISSYDFDKKISGAVAPPTEITQLLGEQQLYFRDSNWNPDFTVAAEQIRWFVENGSGKKIDGVLALDVDALGAIVKATGPLDLPQYNEVITDKNIHERMEFHSEISFDETSTTTDYSTTLFSALFDKLQKLSPQDVKTFATLFRESLEKNTILFSLSDSNENMSIRTLGWSGTLISPDCPAALESSECLVDSIAQVESNVGVNKANYYIERSINHEVSLQEEKVLHKRTITYKNTAQTNTWPKGNYKNYIRLYLPNDVELQNIFYNTSPLPPESITTTIEKDKKIIAFLADLPINSQSIIEIEYSRPSSKRLPYAYAFFEQKQPGILETPFTLTVVPPNGAQPVLIAPEAQVHSQTVVFQEVQSKHLFYGISFK